MEKISFIDFLKKKEEEREDKGNIFPVAITDSEFRNFIVDYLFSDYYFVDPLGHNQINTEILITLLETHSRRFRKELKLYKKLDKKKLKLEKKKLKLKRLEKCLSE